jgi:hypothetical protein
MAVIDAIGHRGHRDPHCTSCTSHLGHLVADAFHLARYSFSAQALAVASASRPRLCEHRVAERTWRSRETTKALDALISSRIR